MGHCNTLLVQCMDYRFMKGIRNFLDEQGMTGDTDLVSLAGAAKNLANPMAPEHKDTLMKQIELASNLHHISKLVLMNHADCGAYGGAAAFASKDEERAAHEADLKAARDLVKASFPNLEVMLVIASLNDDASVAFTTVA